MNTKNFLIATVVLILFILPPNWDTWTGAGEFLSHPFALHAVWLVVLIVSPFLIYKANDGN